MAKITPVPNGPLIKKKGPFKGSTLKSGGTIKKAQNGDTLTVKKPTWQRMTQAQRAAKKAELGPEGFKTYKDSISTDATNRRVKATGLSAEQLAANDLKLKEKMAKKKDAVNEGSQLRGVGKDDEGCAGSPKEREKRIRQEAKRKNGGPIKKAQTGGTYYASSKGRVGRLSGSKIGDNVSAVQNESIDTTGYAKGKKDFTKTINRTFEKPSSKIVKRADVPKVISNLKKGSTAKMDLRTPNQRNKAKMKAGGMIKRADGSMSKRGLWDNIRANKGSGKKPTKQMLVQEKKIKAKK
jgi:hypothetical protein